LTGDASPIASPSNRAPDCRRRYGADAKLQSAIEWPAGVALALQSLGLDRATQGIYDTVEFHQQPVAHGLYQPTMMPGDRGFKHLAQVVLKPRARSFFVDLAQAPIADDIGNQNSGKSALHRVRRKVRRFY
jgi:hypothetical protein